MRHSRQGDVLRIEATEAPAMSPAREPITVAHGEATGHRKIADYLSIGKSVFVRTVTMHYTGRVVGIDRDWIHLDEAAWVADSGRFGAALATGTLSEVEPFPGPCSVARGAIVDVSPWAHGLPRRAQ